MRLALAIPMTDTPTKSDGANAQPIELPSLTLAEFLEGLPPNTAKHIPELLEVTARPGTFTTFHFSFKLPEILIHYTNEICNGPRVYRAWSEEKITLTAGTNYRFLDYLCSNCRLRCKTFSLRMLAQNKEKGGELLPV